MMPEYITKEQAIDAAWDAFTSHDDPDLGRVIEENLERLPPADVAPVVHAQWEETDWGTWGCTNCGCEWQFLEGLSPEENDAKYCPQCGARMDGDGDA